MLLIVTNAKPWSTTHEYTEPNRYLINITASNLHSDENYGYNGFIHNMTRVVIIQHPVKDWSIDFGDPAKWLDNKGRKKDDKIK